MSSPPNHNLGEISMRALIRLRTNEKRGAIAVSGVALLLASATLPGAAAAEDQPAASAKPVAVGEVIVTAQRRSQSVQNVPAAITALDKVTLSQRGVTDIATLQFAVPSLTFGRTLGSTQIAIRGVGRSVGQPGVAVNIDGVYQPRDTPMIADQADLARIEVLRGPQGTLYGRNANGGAVNFITNAPESTFGGYVAASYAEYDERRLQAVLNVPFSDRIRTRLVVDSDVRDDGFVKNIVPGGPELDKERLLAGRLRVDVDLARNLTLDLNLNAAHGGPVGDYYVLTALPSAAGIAMNPYLANAIVPLTPWRTSATGPSGSDRTFQSYAATLDWRLPIGELKSITAYQSMVNDWDMDRGGADVLVGGAPQSIIQSTAKERSSTFTQEFDVSGKAGPVDWVAGLYYMADRDKQDTFFAFPLGFAPLPPNFFLHFSSPKSDTHAYAAFADGTWRVTDRLHLIAGIRFSEDRLDVVHTNDIGLLVPRMSVAVICPTETDNLRWDSVTYRAGAQYELGPAKQAYFTVSDGFKSGGVNLSGCDNAFNPETITSYEGGFKGRFFGDRLSLRVSAFWYDYSQFQVAQVVGIVAAITNAASATEKGLELESDWSPNEHLSINASLSVLDARFGTFINTDTLNLQLGAQNLDGHILPNAPKVSGSLGLAYRTSLTDLGRLTLRADVSARSRVYFSEFNTFQESQAAYAVVDTNIIWDSPNGAYSVRLFANNLLNKAYWTAIGAVQGLGAPVGSWGDPRQVGVELKARF
jgi:iron complex outermembrane receptor protein